MRQVKMPILYVSERFDTGEVKATEHVADVWMPLDLLVLPGCRYRPDITDDLIFGTPDRFEVRRLPQG